MQMTLVEKILKAPAGKVVKLKPDLCVINDGEGHNCVGLMTKQRELPEKVD